MSGRTLILSALNQAYAITVESGRRDFWQYVHDYIDAHASDRRYKLAVNASSSNGQGVAPSAIVTYRGRRIYVTLNYKTNTYESEQ